LRALLPLSRFLLTLSCFIGNVLVNRIENQIPRD